MPEMQSKLELVVNGRASETSARTIAELLQERDLTDDRVATALNGHFIAHGKRATTALSTGDKVEIVSARQGG